MYKKILFTISMIILLISGCSHSDKMDPEDKLLSDYGIVVKALKDIASNIRQYKMEFGEFPESGTIEEIHPKLKKLKHPFETPLKDPWGNPYYYIYKPEYKSEFYLYSKGSDNLFKGLDQKGRYDLKELNKGPDVVYFEYLIFWPDVDQLTPEQMKIFFRK